MSRATYKGDEKMDPQIGRVTFKLAFFVTFVAAILLIFLEPGTAEFVVDIIALLVGLVFIGVIIFIVRKNSRL